MPTTPDTAVPITLVSAADLPAWLEAHPAQRAWLSATGFKARPGSFALVPGANGELGQVLAAPAEGAPVWALAALPNALPEGRYRLDSALAPADATAAALGWALASYAFTRYRAAKRAPAQLDLPAGADAAEVARLQGAVSLARDLINTPAEDLGPEHLAAAARAVAERSGAQLSVIRGDDLLAQNYPTVHAVGRASTRAPVLIDLRWGDASAPRVTLVGKGVCFDTGGLDLKTAAGMLHMKKDMGGAAITLGLAQALMDAGAPIRLRVLIPAVDNAVAGNAIRPLDIVRTRSGKTVEIGNTDAEGRLILCDALWEADTEEPDLLVDVATLTGAARVALGPDLQALFCDDEAAAQALQQAGMAAGDPMWRLPLWKPYLKNLDAKIADLKNVSGSPHGGAIYAALYLSEFVSKARTWAHLDVAGSNDKAQPGRPEGGEATGLRALYSYIRQRYG
ncbi:leucyl aminopeptidase family protein [Ideonella sp. BN130291]|uniref:leucyl aminopeptidase family protein n=1 Tax=Ideonella sp. BN130291 TaxID=3112940 RepID=UPI002E272FEB|nr:leucyl aminopeptidase family protein [Ideonella sp. BN130291]